VQTVVGKLINGSYNALLYQQYFTGNS